MVSRQYGTKNIKNNRGHSVYGGAAGDCGRVRQFILVSLLQV